MAMKIALYFVCGVGWVLLGVWYFRSAYRTFFDTRLPEVIAPFEFIGKDDKNDARGRALAQTLVARLDSLQQEIKDAVSALRGSSEAVPPAERASGGASFTPVDPAKPIHFGTTIQEIPKLQLSVSGVELSGVLNWIYRSLAEGRAIRVVVLVPDGEQKVTVAAHLETPGINDLWLPDLESSEKVWVEQVALDILRQHVGRSVQLRQAAGLERAEFAKLISALRTVALLNRKVQSNVLPSAAEYTQVVNDLDPILARTPRWRVLIGLAAEAAKNSRDLTKARELYQRDLDLVLAVEPPGRPLTLAEQKESERLKGIVQDLDSRLRPSLAVSVAAKAPGIDLLTTWPGNLMAVPAAPPKGGNPRVAVLGGTPLANQKLALDGAELLKQPEMVESSQSDVLREHVGHIAETVRSIAPNARFVYAPMRSSNGTATEGDLLAALSQLIQVNPDIIVIPLGTQDGFLSPVWQAALRQATEVATVVLPAGNKGKDARPPLDQTDLGKQVIVVAAVDKEGHRAEFSSFSDAVLWAPGVDIPVGSVGPNAAPSGQRIFSGTSFSAALTAGAVARLKGEKPTLTPAEILRVLRETSKAVAPDGPKVIQLAPALKQIGS
jgi:hypothetical protein